jgi:hypothetical protein
MSGYKIRIVETTDPDYDASFIDSYDALEILAGDTDVLSMNTADRNIDFTNTRKPVPILGLSLDNRYTVALIIVLIACIPPLLFPYCSRLLMRRFPASIAKG